MGNRGVGGDSGSGPRVCVATIAIASDVMSSPRVPLDPYVVDVLLPDLVGHDRKPSAFLVYLHLLCAAARLRRDDVPVSLQTIAVRTGLSKSSVQSALRHLVRRGLLDAREPATSVHVVRTVRRPWVR
jgi:hypothetical protein